MRFGRSFPVPRKLINVPPLINYTAIGNLSTIFQGAMAPSGAQITYYPTGLLSAGFFASAIVPGAAPAPVITGPGLHGLSQRFIETVTTDHRWRVKIEVHTAQEAFLADLTEYVTGGQVEVDETTEIRRTLTLTLNASKALIPVDGDDLLHPASANELWVWRGVEYPDGTTEYAQLGVFRISKPVIVDNGSSLTFTISGNSRSSVVARQAWSTPPGPPSGNGAPNGGVPITRGSNIGTPGTPYTIPPGANISGAIETALDYLLSPIYGNTISYAGFNNDIFPFPLTVFGATPGQSSDPMSDLQTFAAASQYELFFDVTGQPVLRIIINPAARSTTVVDAVHFIDGVNCTVTTTQRTIDETTAYNGVVLYCNGTGPTLPFVTSIWDTNVDSPTYYLGPWGRVPYVITTTTIPSATGVNAFSIDHDNAYMMALKQFQLVLGSMEDISLTCVPNPALREGDVVRVTQDRLDIDAYYVISQMTIPLDPSTPQSITFRPQVDPAS